MAAAQNRCRNLAGKLYLKDLSTPNQPYLYVGNSSSELTVSETETSQDDLTNPAGGKSCTIKTIDAVGLKLDIFNASVENIVRAIFGKSLEEAATAIVDEPIVGFLGALIPTKRVIDTSVVPVVTGSLGTPTYVLGADYTVDGAGILVVESSSLATAISASVLTGLPKRLNLLIDYTPKIDTDIQALTSSGKSYAARIQGINRADSGKEEIWDIWKIAFGPTGSFNIVAKDFSNFTITGTIQPDVARPPNDSQYFQVKVVS